MIEGRKVTVITKVFMFTHGRSMGHIVERSVRVHKFRQYLSANETRRQDLIQFWDKHGKLHTVAAEDIVL